MFEMSREKNTRLKSNNGGPFTDNRKLILISALESFSFSLFFLLLSFSSHLPSVLHSSLQTQQASRKIPTGKRGRWTRICWCIVWAWRRRTTSLAWSCIPIDWRDERAGVWRVSGRFHSVQNTHKNRDASPRISKSKIGTSSVNLMWEKWYLLKLVEERVFSKLGNRMSKQCFCDKTTVFA